MLPWHGHPCLACGGAPAIPTWPIPGLDSVNRCAKQRVLVLLVTFLEGRPRVLCSHTARGPGALAQRSREHTLLYDGLPGNVRDREHGVEDVTGRENTPHLSELKQHGQADATASHHREQPARFPRENGKRESGPFVTPLSRHQPSTRGCFSGQKESLYVITVYSLLWTQIQSSNIGKHDPTRARLSACFPSRGVLRPQMQNSALDAQKLVSLTHRPCQQAAWTRNFLNVAVERTQGVDSGGWSVPTGDLSSLLTSTRTQCQRSASCPRNALAAFRGRHPPQAPLSGKCTPHSSGRPAASRPAAETEES